MITEEITSTQNWQKLTPEEKLEKRLEAWLSAPGVEFASDKAREDYTERVTNIIDAMQLKKVPRRVPVTPMLGAFATAYCGYTQYDIMNDVDKAIEVTTKCTLDFQPDTVMGAMATPAKLYEIVDFKLYTWPGDGLPADADGVQYVEDEYMTVDEYDALIENPTEYWQRTYLPRIMGALAAFNKLPYPLCGAGATAAIPSTLSAYGLPEVQAALEKAIEAGKILRQWQQKMGAATRKLTEMGFPTMGGGQARAPFDLIGDSMRGTRGIIFDMYRHPDKLIKAMEALVPIEIRMGVETTRFGGCPIVGFAMHKGADGFMSDEQFRTFYWPTLRQIIMGLIEEGLIPRLGAQGGYNSRLEVINDLPKGKTVWAYGAETDMVRAKEIMGDVACMTGNLPASLFVTGTVEETVDHCKKLIDTAGKGGGYMLSTASGVNRNGRIENVRAMIQCAKEYGVYS
ncbi:uroporphyrinogen decarboxylase family protein [Chloroflexota bacterium]